jgi:hypothetical protein
VGKPEGEISLESPRRGWVDNIKVDAAEIGWRITYWIELAQDREH